MDKNKSWWQRPMRVIQTNLQVMDTPRMDTEKIASEIEAMGANVLVMNVGGIYAWYPTQVPCHTVNPCLPQNSDLLRDMIAACHRRGIRFVARYDFSKASDNVYQRRPQWFSRNPDGTPQPIGVMRPGNWDLLYSTCINSDYRNEEIAAEILRESLSKYEIDGVFFNAPHATSCHCDRCREKYEALYDMPLPDDQKQWHAEWKSRCLYDNMQILRKAIRSVRDDVPSILYYAITSDNLYERLATCDMICAEPQDVLSLGWKEIPQSFKPALCIRLGCSEPDIPRPFGIIHSCPGMDWRHVGLPSAEYMYWMSQVPANGGQIWHSITGFPDTITDKRILENVSAINHQIMAVEPYMEGAQSNAKIALLWDMNGDSMDKAFGGQLASAANGWAEAMLNSQLPFDMVLPQQILSGRLEKYDVLIAPSGLQDEALVKAVDDFVCSGGQLLVECATTPSAACAALMGVAKETQVSEYLQASYLRLEAPANVIREGLEETSMLPHRGRTVYVRATDAQTWCTLVPPFAPMEAVGAPPERASLNCPQTDIPLVLMCEHGKGRVMSVTFALSAMIAELKLHDHTMLVSNMLKHLLGEALDVYLQEQMNGIQLMDYVNENHRVIHLVNGIGQRPLSQNIPISVTVCMKWEGTDIPSVKSLLCGTPQVNLKDGLLTIKTAPVATWEVLCVEASN